MALIKCPECNHDVSEQAAMCPNCGYVINKKEEKIKPKYIIPIVIALICVIIITVVCAIIVVNNTGDNDKSTKKNKNNNQAQELTGADEAAYDMMMEICNRADDPSDVSVISGTVTRMTDGRWTGTLKVKASGKIYNLIIDYEDGEYLPSEIQDEILSYADDMLTDINFNKRKVQDAIDEYWD